MIEVGGRGITKAEFAEFYKRYPKDGIVTASAKAGAAARLVELEILVRESNALAVTVGEDELARFMRDTGLEGRSLDSARLHLLRGKIAERLVSAETVGPDVADLVAREPAATEARTVFRQIFTVDRSIAERAVGELGRGVPFETVAATFSQAPDAVRGGLIDYLDDNDMPAELRDLLATLAAGQTSGIAAMQGGYRIVRLEKRIGRRVLGEDERRKSAEQRYRRQAAGTAYGRWYAERQKAYGVRIRWDDIASVE